MPENPQAFNRNRPKPPFKKQPIEPPGLETEMQPRPQYMAPNYLGSEKLKGKVALITGGDSGIGRAVAVLFAREGADVAFVHLQEEEADAAETMEAIEVEGREGFHLVGDVSDFATCERIVETVVERFGRIDILVNNSAFQQHVDNFEDLSVEQFRHTFEVNVFGYFQMVKAAIKHMKEGSNIINTSSILGYDGSGTLIDYASTKGAIHILTKSLAEALLKKSIRVNAVAPGPVWTPLNPAERGEGIKDFGKKADYGRPAQPEEIAPAYVYLASNVTASYITGETINIFGSAASGAN